MGRIIITIGMVLASIIWPAPIASDAPAHRLAAVEAFKANYGVDLSHVEVLYQHCADHLNGWWDGERICVDPTKAGYDTMLHEFAHAYDDLHQPHIERHGEEAEDFADFVAHLLRLKEGRSRVRASSGGVLAPSQSVHASSCTPPQAAPLAGPYSALRFPVNPSFVGVSLATLGDGQCSAL